VRWYEVNSEQLDAIADAIVAYHGLLTASIASARQAGLIRQYDLERGRLEVVQRALDAIADIRKTET
jgi:hypothetical protein